MEQIIIRRALLSVSDKAGLVDFARTLTAQGIELISTGGTAKTLSDAGLAVQNISDVTGFPEMLEGRVKTLHPKVHGGILADRDKPDHLDTIEAHSITPIDLICVNLYPFAATIAKPDVTLEDAIENIDIGGPAMVRSAAKNHHGVAVVVDPLDYAPLLEEMAQTGGLSLETRKRLAAKAFAHTAAYDSAIADYLEKVYLQPEAADAGRGNNPIPAPVLPQTLRLNLPRIQILRYGENPHQQGAFYREPVTGEPCIGNARRRDNGGKEVSFNNLYDLNAALELVKELPEMPAAAIIKHTNPCGCAMRPSLAEAFAEARSADTISAFGGILAVNRPLDRDTAEKIVGPNTFFECIVAPSYEAGVVEILTQSKKWGANLRLLEVGDVTGDYPRTGYDLKKIVGGLLLQERDTKGVTAADLTVQSRRAPTDAEIAELLFAWRIVKYVRSNAIVITKNTSLLGAGAGQMNRVRSVRLAVEQSAGKSDGAALASDAFFPFPDGPETAIAAGVTAIIQPGGSVRDEETIAVCNQHDVALVFTGIRHFLH